jgi:antigen
MKKLLQIPLAVILIASVNAYAEDLAASKALILEAAKETMQELQKDTDGKKPTPEAVGKKLMAKLRARMDDFKKAYESDCVSAHGKDKAKECKCFIEKTDFDETLKQLKQQMLKKTSGTKFKNKWVKKKMKSKEPATCNPLKKEFS